MRAGTLRGPIVESKAHRETSATARLLIEDFIATCPLVYIEHDNHLWECGAEQRGGAIWLIPATPIDVHPATTVSLCCPHTTGLYRFSIDLLEVYEDRIVATRSVTDPLGWRVSLRGRVNRAVELTPVEGATSDTRVGRTQNISRLGMLVVLARAPALNSTWYCRLTLAPDEELEVTGRVVRIGTPATDNEPGRYGFQFIDVPLDTQRRLFEFILANAEPTAEDDEPAEDS